MKYVFPAKLPGQCGGCGEKYHQGDMIGRIVTEGRLLNAWTTAYAHEDCMDDNNNTRTGPQRYGAICPVCHMEKSVTGMCPFCD